MPIPVYVQAAIFGSLLTSLIIWRLRERRKHNAIQAKKERIRKAASACIALAEELYPDCKATYYVALGSATVALLVRTGPLRTKVLAVHRADNEQAVVGVAEQLAKDLWHYRHEGVMPYRTYGEIA